MQTKGGFQADPIVPIIKVIFASNEDLMKHLVNISNNIRETLLRLDEITDFEILTLFVTDNKGAMVGSLTDGDVRRGF